MIGIKRAREDELEIDQLHGEAKKPRGLPLRSSPTTQHAYLSFGSRPRLSIRPQTLTPAESEDEDSDIELVSPKDKSRQAPMNLYIGSMNTQEDMDLDMDSPQPMSDPIWSPKPPDSATYDTFSAPLLSRLNIPSVDPNKGSTIQNARIPTPIYGHFSNPTLDTPSDTSVPTPVLAPPTSAALPHPRIRTTHIEASEAFFRRRALPSPISEDENMDSPTMMTKSMLSNLKMSATPSSDTFPQPIELISPESPPKDLPQGWANAPGLTLGRNRRRRSDAISGGAGESGKVVFSMGFRADCEKCRERVPGHYSHVIRA